MIFQPDIEVINAAASKVGEIAGHNLALYRQHCQMSLREVSFQTDIHPSLLFSYEKAIIKIVVYAKLIIFYRQICKHLGIGEPEGIIRLSTLLDELS